MHCPDILTAGTRFPKVVANIDIGPTLLGAAGLGTPKHMDGANFFPLLLGREQPWRNALLYEYFWEWNYPHTPTMHAMVGERYKYIRYHGLWDVNELYDLEKDPDELRNLIFDSEHQDLVTRMNDQLWKELEATGGDSLALKRDRGSNFPLRLPGKSKEGRFPAEWFKP